ncbi:MAG TPA: sialate O-acetylesterase [Polyangiaceae bacterium]|nr:sialate O-acetylesterase [Polyangiaceae bacterium]
MKQLLDRNLSGARRGVVALFVLAAAACGVVEHPHGDVQAIDTTGDLGPSGGVPVATPTAGTSAGGVTSYGGAGGGVTVTAGSGGSAGSSSSGSGSGGAAPGGSGGLSGVTITLGGVNVPKEKAIAFIHVGHSNMAGQARTPQSSRAYHMTETHPHAFMYHAGSAPTLAIEPKTAGGPGAGPGTAMVKEAATAAPDYYFVSLGYGKPSAYCSQFLPGALYYDELIAAPKAAKGRVTFGGIFIYLGITERHGSAADLNGFPDCINKLVTAIRTDIGEPNLPALMNDYEVDGSGEFAVTGAVATAIMPQIAKCPSVVSNFALVSADGVPMEDDHHFNFDGQRMWVQRAFQTMKDKGWRFWAP